MAALWLVEPAWPSPDCWSVGCCGGSCARVLRRAHGHDQSPITAEQVTAAIDKAEALGADTTAVHRELAERQRRREHAEIHVALFGEISSGKSALAQALLPQAEIE